MNIVLGCNCDECRRAWVADISDYATFLEETVLEIKGVLDTGRGGGKRARRMLRALASVAARRNLTGEIATAQFERDMKTAADLAEAGRLQ